MSSKKTLALDLATNTGWALNDEKGFVKIGSINVSKHPDSKVGQQWASFKSQLVRLIVENEIEEIAFEQIDHIAPMKKKGGGQVTPTRFLLLYGGLRSIVELISVEMNIPLTGYHIKEIKKSFTGNGNAAKEIMVQKALSLGFVTKNDDEADALATLRLHLKSIKDN